MTTLSAWILILSITLADGQTSTTLQAFGNQPDCADAAIEAVADNMATAVRISVSCKPQDDITQSDLIPTDLIPQDAPEAAPAQPSAENPTAAPDLPSAVSPGQASPSHDRNL